MVKGRAIPKNSFLYLDMQWVEEKTRGRVSEKQVSTISINLLRKQGPNAVCQHLCSLEKVFYKMLFHMKFNLLLTFFADAGCLN